MAIVVSNDGVIFTPAGGDAKSRKHGDVVVAVGPDGTAIGGAKAEDSASTTGDTGTPVMFVRTPASPAAQTSADGDYGFPAIDSFGDQKALICDSTGTPITYNINGRAAAASSVPVVLSTEDAAALGTSAAHDAAISGNPVRVAARALSADYTAVSTGDTADLKTTLVGALITKPYALPELDWSYAAPSGGKTATGGVTIKVAPGASLRNYVTGLQIANSGAAGTEVQIKDGAGGTVIWRGYVPAAFGGVPITLPSPLRQPTAATLLEIDLSSGVTVAVYVNAQGFVAP